MVRSESADEIIERYDDEGLEEEFSPQPRWGSQMSNEALQRPHSRTASSLSPTSGDPDRRLRRQIANCNERRRMQSINAGFQSLRALLPKKEGEKLSKAAILQQTADLIHQLQGERQRLMRDSDGVGGKKAKMDCDISEDQHDIIQRLQLALERERSNRMYLEQQIGQMREQIIYQHGLSPASPSGTMSNGLVTSTNVKQPSPTETSTVIRPTPLPPISVEVSGRVSGHVLASHSSSPLQPLVSIPMVTSSVAASVQSTISQMTSSFPNGVSSNGHGSAFSAHRSLQTILDAIRHLEGGGPFINHSPPPTSQAPLVRYKLFSRPRR